MNLSPIPISARLRFSAYSYKLPRTLNVAVNGTALATVRLAHSAPVDFRLSPTLQPGNNIITFASREPPLPTDDPSVDSRLLSFAMYGVSLQTR